MSRGPTLLNPPSRGVAAGADPSAQPWEHLSPQALGIISPALQEEFIEADRGIARAARRQEIKDVLCVCVHRAVTALLNGSQGHGGALAQPRFRDSPA